MVSGDGWRQAPGRVLKQGFIAVSRERVVRVRVDGEQGWLTVKAMVTDASRLEFEYPIPLADAEQMLAQVCRRQWKNPPSRHRGRACLGSR